MMISNFPNFKISLVMRQTNFVAHYLAMTSKFYVSCGIFDYILSFISHVLMNEIIQVYYRKINFFAVK
jgi:CRISPR/Cas system endoribonuclease Cas6 (RAMP superfamily)